MLNCTNFILGGIRNFTSNDSAVKKWCLSRAEQSKNTLKLKEKAETSKTSSNYTCLRSSKILQSDKAVCQVMCVLTEEYINPFDVTIEKNDLLNLSSGIQLQSDEVLKSYEIGQEKYKTFVKERIQETFNDPIQKSKLQTFKNAGKAKVTRNGKTAVIEVNRNAIAKLLANSTKFEKNIDFEVALAYPLTSVPSRRVSRTVTHKSKLMEVPPQD